jgi:NDP-sugar pyrophosphorylase family protein
MIAVERFCRRIRTSPFAAHAQEPPWRLVAALRGLVAAVIDGLGDGWHVSGGVAVHRTATVEAGAVVKPPAVVGRGAFVATGAYLRGGVFLDDECVVGPGAEAKTSLLLRGATLAHFNFVGDSILGEGVNCEAGAIIANHRNERADRRIRILFEGAVLDTGCDKFGALVGDGSRIGANAVVAPGALLPPGTVVGRLALVDQGPPGAG